MNSSHSDESSQSSILIAAVPFSENLGDQVIAECTEHLVRQLMPTAAVSFLDFSGRRAKSEHSKFRGTAATSIFFRTPARLRPSLVLSVLLPQLLFRHRAHWTALVRRADVILVGGGQLLQDVYLNFPLKLWAFAAIVRRVGRRYTLFAVGVDPHWSSLGKRLFRSALSSNAIQSASCRDSRSTAALRELLPDVVTPTLAADPALYATEVFGEVPHIPNLVGVNIAHPSELATRPELKARFRREDLLSLWVGTIAGLVALGYGVQVFTNGSRADEEFARAVNDALRKEGVDLSTVRMAERPASARALASLVARCEILIAHRLHACILAVAYQRRVVPLGWDVKLDSFFSLLGRAQECVAPEDISPDLLLDRVVNGRPPISPERVSQLKLTSVQALEAALRPLIRE